MTDKFILDHPDYADKRITIGKYTYGKPKITLWSDSDHVRIGSFCSIAENVNIIAGGDLSVNLNLPYSEVDRSKMIKIRFPTIKDP